MLKKLVITQVSFMAFNPSSKLFNDCDLKIMFNKHEGFYIKREDFIRETNMEEKAQVGYLNNEFTYLLIMVSPTRKDYNLVGCKSEQMAKKLLSAIILSNRLLELKALSTEMNYMLNPYYLEYIINSSNNEVFFFKMKPSMVTNSEEEMFVKFFLSKGEFIENLEIEGFGSTLNEVEKISTVIVSSPQQQFQRLYLRDCKISDEGFASFGRAIRHSSYLTELWLDCLEITDNSLKELSGLWQYTPFLEEVHITRCKNLKGEHYFGGFLSSVATGLSLKLLDLSRNSFSEVIIGPLVNEFLCVENLEVKKLDLSYNVFTPRDNWTLFQLYLKSPMKSCTQLVLAPYPIHEAYFSHLTTGKKFNTIVFERVSLTSGAKTKILSNEDLMVCKDIFEEINQCLLFQKTIEEVLAVCKRIHDLPFEFPPQYVERLSEMLREHISTTYNAEDYYGFSVIYECAQILGVSRSDSNRKQDSMMVKSDQTSQEINKLMNFKFEENKLNILLADLVQKVINLDIRGSGVDLLLYLKDLRDKYVMSYISKRIDQIQVENEMMESEPYYILESNETLEERSRFIDEKNLVQVIGAHPKTSDYLKISELTRATLIKEYEHCTTGSDIVTRSFLEKVCMYLVSPKNVNYLIQFKADVLGFVTKALLFYKHDLSQKTSLVIGGSKKVPYLMKLKNVEARMHNDHFKPLNVYLDDEKRLQEKLKSNLQSQSSSVGFTNIASQKDFLSPVTGIACASIQKVDMGLLNREYTEGMFITSVIFTLLENDFLHNEGPTIALLTKVVNIVREGDIKGIYPSKYFLSSELLLQLLKILNSSDNLSHNQMRNGNLSLTFSSWSFEFLFQFSLF